MGATGSSIMYEFKYDGGKRGGITRKALGSRSGFYHLIGARVLKSQIGRAVEIMGG